MTVGGEKKKVTQVCWAGWWQMWDWDPTSPTELVASGWSCPGLSWCAEPATLQPVWFSHCSKRQQELPFYVFMVSVVNIITNYNWLGSSVALHWHRLKGWKHLYFQKTPLLASSTTPARWLVHLSEGAILHEWMCCLQTWRPLVLREEAHFQIGKQGHNIHWKPLEVRVSPISLQKLPCLHSSHSVSVTICEQHLETDFSKPGFVWAFQPLSPTSRLSRICCCFEIQYVPRKSPPQFCELAQSLISCI